MSYDDWKQIDVKGDEADALSRKIEAAKTHVIVGFEDVANAICDLEESQFLQMCSHLADVANDNNPSPLTHFVRELLLGETYTKKAEVLVAN